MTAGLETFAKVRALHDRTDSPGEKAAAMLKMQTLARKAGMSVDEAVSTLDAPDPEVTHYAETTANAFNDFFNSPEIRASMAKREAERRARCRELLKRYGTEDAVFADTERETALRDACAPLLVWDTRPDWKGCYDLGGWGSVGSRDKMPAAVREAVTKAWLWPETVAEAWTEYEAAEALDNDRYAFVPDYSAHQWIEARRYVLEDLLDSHPARSLNDLRARLSWMEHLSSLQCQWTHDRDAIRLATLRADIERMGVQIRQDRTPAETSANQPDDNLPAGQVLSTAALRSTNGSPDPGDQGNPDPLSVQNLQAEGWVLKTYPLRRTNADKRRAVLALLDAEISGTEPLSDREIARRAGVSPQTVGNIRRAQP